MAAVKPEAFESLTGAEIRKFDGTLLFGPNWELVQRLRTGVVRTLAGDHSDTEIVKLSNADLESQPGRLLEELQGISLFGGFKVVLVEASGTGALKECVSACSVGWRDCFLLVTAGDLKKSSPVRKEFEASPDLAAVICYEQSASQLASVVASSLSAAGVHASMEVCQAVVQAVAGNAALLESEVAKLVDYAGSSDALSVEDVEAVCALNRSSTVDRIIDLVFTGQVDAALSGLRELRSEGSGAAGVLIALTNHFIMLSEMVALSGGRRVEAVVKEWRPPVFWKRQDVVGDEVRRLAGADVAALGSAIAAANASSRLSHEIDWPILERLVLALATKMRSRA